ncbi:hypothetical protein [Methyloversatilis thermotolerans]|uniref:hypothetical protein n=1 Tax=Methyloversatilis thermotolerans TaxID=1346290 RepID=UPI000375997C|nr:hypothetical protein [Methyloversatilis thermotolerans]
MPALVANSTTIDLAPAKTTGLNELGVPLVEGTLVKKGKLGEFSQALDDGRVGRMYQNVRAIAVRTIEGGAESAKLFLLFEVFGDNNTPLAPNIGLSLRLWSGTDLLLEMRQPQIFLPYACAWYDNRIVFDIPVCAFERADRLELQLLDEPVRMV